MYKKTYRVCIHCEREIISSRHGDHQRKCLNEKIKKPTGHPKGLPAWNKGLTKNTDSRVFQNGISISNTLKQQVKDGIYVPRKMGIKARTELSERQSIQNLGGRSKWFTINDMKVQGTWEYNIALKLNELKINWKRPTGIHSIKYVMDNVMKTYTPDFYLPTEDLYLEVKGHWWGNDKEKMKCVFEQFPDKNIVLIEKNEYKKILDGELVW